MSKKDSKTTYFIDFGREFFNQHANKIYEAYNVHHYGAMGPIKCAFAESHLRGLKQKLYKYYTKNPVRGTFPKILQQIVAGKNNTQHSSHGYKPSEITLENQHLVFDALYSDYYKKKKHVKPLYSKGELVRLTKLHSPFAKGFRKNFTDEIFEIADVIQTRVPPMYRIKSRSDNVMVMGSFYSFDLVKVHE